MDLLDYHEKQEYPSHRGALAGILVVFGGFIVLGSFAVYQLWQTYGPIIMSLIAPLNLPSFLTDNIFGIVLILGGLIFLSLLMAFAAAAAAKRLGGTLIKIGAVMMNLLTWGMVVIAVIAGVPIMEAWPIMIPGFMTLFMSLLLFTIWKDRVRRAGEIIKLTGQVGLDEKGVFVPQLLTMLFTLISAVLFGAIIVFYVPGLVDVVFLGAEATTEQLLAGGLGIVVYLFVTIFFYNFSYATTSGIVYIYMRGSDPDLGDGVRSALNVVGGLIVLSIATVIVTIIRMIIQAVARKSGSGGRMVGGFASGIIGWVWALINYFTIPSMIGENLGAKDGIKRSASLVKNNFVDVIIKETAVKWGFGVLSLMMFLGFAFGGFLLGWLFPFSFVGNDPLLSGLVLAVVFIIFASIPSTLVMRTFDIVYITLLYVFIRKKDGDFTKIAIPSSMDRELTSAYDRASQTGYE
ncbi:MAG: DUF6159 family protein [Candidatus Thorarchaeota archaeon]